MSVFTGFQSTLVRGLRWLCTLCLFLPSLACHPRTGFVPKVAFFFWPDRTSRTDRTGLGRWRRVQAFQRSARQSSPNSGRVYTHGCVNRCGMITSRSKWDGLSVDGQPSSFALNSNKLFECFSKLSGNLPIPVEPRWHDTLPDGRENVADETRSGRPSTWRGEHSVYENSEYRSPIEYRVNFWTCLDTPKSSVRRVVSEDCAKLVPKVLTKFGKSTGSSQLVRNWSNRVRTSPTSGTTSLPGMNPGFLNTTRQDRIGSGTRRYRQKDSNDRIERVKVIFWRQRDCAHTSADLKRSVLQVCTYEFDPQSEPRPTRERQYVEIPPRQCVGTRRLHIRWCSRGVFILHAYTPYSLENFKNLRYTLKPKKINSYCFGFILRTV